MPNKPPQVLLLKITLLACDPALWRAIEIRSDKTLPHLHDAIQAAFLWNDMHLWDFRIGARTYQMKQDEPWVSPMFGPRIMDAATKRLRFFLSDRASEVIYTYDFGDDWAHRVELVSTRPVEPDERLPRFVEGRWATPPEDIGGPPFYALFKEAWRNEDHPDHGWAREAGYVDWAADEIHADVIAEQFRGLQRRKQRQIRAW